MMDVDAQRQLTLDLKEIFKRLDELETNPLVLSGGSVPPAGTIYNHLEDDGAAWTSVTNMTMADGASIRSPAGLVVEFDDTNNYLEITGGNVGINATVPGARLEINVPTATDVGLIIQTTDDNPAQNLTEWQSSAAGVLLSVEPDGDLSFSTGIGIIHADGVTAGWVLRADGTRYVPASGASTLPIAPVAVGDTLIAVNTPPLEWAILTTPGAAGYVRVSTATTEVWSQTPTLTGDWTWTSSTSTKPILTLENTNVDTASPSIDFYKNTASPADNDDIGIINFYGETSTGAKERYGYILVESLDVTNTDTAGGFDFIVVMDDVERSLLQLSGYNGTVDEGRVVVNASGQDVDFRVGSAIHTDALSVRGNDSQVRMESLGAGFVQSDATGVLSSAAIAGTDLPWSGAATQVAYWSGPNTLTGDAGMTYNAATDSLTAGDFFTTDGGQFGISGNELLTVNAAGNFTFSGVTSVVVPNGAWVGADANASWVFDTSNNDVTTLDNVGIGTAAPSSPSGAAKFLEIRDNTHTSLVLNDSGAAGQEWEFFSSAGNLYTRLSGSTKLFYDSGGGVFINDTANTFMTIGLTVNQGANDDELYCGKSSDVAHGITDYAETDTYFTVNKHDADAGGARIRGFRDANSDPNRALVMQGFLGEACDTGKTATDAAIVSVAGFVKSGTGIGATTANGNVFGVRTDRGAGVISIMFVDEDGDIWLDAGGGLGNNVITGSAIQGYNTFDDHDDLALLDGFRASLAPTGHELKERFAQQMDYARPVLEKAGIVSYNEVGNNFVSMRGLAYLTVDALRQVATAAFEEIADLRQLCGEQAARLTQLENKLLEA